MRSILAFIAALPGPILAALLLIGQDFIAAVASIAVAAGSCAWVALCRANCADETAVVRLLLVSSTGGWLCGWVALLVISLTPLCIGQNNDHGLNTIGYCIFGALVGPFVAIPYAIVVILPCVAFGSFVFVKFGRTRTSD